MPHAAAHLQKPQSSGHLSTVTIAVLLSLVLHIALFFFLLLARESDTPEPEAVFTVDITPDFLNQLTQQHVPKKQLVTPSDKSEQTSASEKPDFESEKDSVVSHQTIKRGDDPEAGKKESVHLKQNPEKEAPAQKSAANPVQLPPQKIQAKNPAQKHSEQKQPAKPIITKSAKPSQPQDLQHSSPNRSTSSALNMKMQNPDETFPSNNSTEDLEEESEPEQSRDDMLQAAILGGAAPSLKSYEAFSRPAGSGARFLGLRGSQDYLPNLPDGDLTLLNAKANKFAVFVRRIAIQVFSQLRASGWEHLSANDIRRIQDNAQVHVVLSLAGNILSSRVTASCGNPRFDQILLAAAQKGARDPHPPKDAVASDGNIHIVFEAKSWVQIYGDPRSRAPREQRWLMLGTGLD